MKECDKSITLLKTQSTDFSNIEIQQLSMLKNKKKKSSRNMEDIQKKVSNLKERRERQDDKVNTLMSEI